MNPGANETPRSTTRRHRGALAGVLVVASIGVMAMVALVVMALNRTAPPTYLPTVREPRGAAAGMVGPELFTADATAENQWQFFSFARGSLVGEGDPLGWDLAFQRFRVIVNGGAGFAGAGGVVDLGEVSFDEVESVPAEGYIGNRVRSDTVNVPLRDWYSYSYFSHLLSPKPKVYAIRTADGRYAKLQFMGYYCPGARPGCMTFRYVYQSDGGRVVSGSDDRGAALTAP